MKDKETFIQLYCEASNCSWECLQLDRKAVPCNCGDLSCDGWKMIPIEEEE